MQKSKRVRLRYPDEFVELARILQSHCNKRDVARALELPLSTLYRWTNCNASGGAVELDESAKIDRLRMLAGICEQSGFDVYDGLKRLLPRWFEVPFVGEPKNTPVPLPSSTATLDIVLSGTESTLQRRLLAAKCDIERFYYTRLSIDDLARRVGMTKFNFSHAFRAAFAVSPYRYLNQIRVERAKHMLMLTRQPLDLVAASVGFSSLSSLNRAFRRFAGASPGNVVVRMAAVSVRAPASLQMTTSMSHF
jgi:AraC-like DNA-binding protein